jgi:hypothetical protein
VVEMNESEFGELEVWRETNSVLKYSGESMELLEQPISFGGDNLEEDCLLNVLVIDFKYSLRWSTKQLDFLHNAALTLSSIILTISRLETAKLFTVYELNIIEMKSAKAKANG